MKNKGIWLIIISIVVAGVCMTVSIRNFVAERSISTEYRALESSGSQEEAKAPQETAAPESTSPVMENTPLGTFPVAESGGAQHIEPQTYLAHLAELDAQIAQARSDGSANAGTARTLTENELRLWENELGTVSEALSADMDEQQKTEFAAEMLAWRKDRETKAAEASRKYEGSTMEALEYTKNLTEITRTRVYELANEL